MDDGSATFEIAKDGLSGLVVGFDESEPSLDALAYATGIARRERAWMVVVSVTVIPSTVAMAGVAGFLIPDGDDVPDVMRRIAEFGVDATFRRVTGDVVAGLERVAEESRADAIVVGRSRSRAHAYVGSVTKRLVGRAVRPVIVVP